MSEQKDTAFSLAVEQYLDAGDREARVQELAAAFEVSPSTVGRWARGTASPHPRLQRQILARIEHT